jgi:hypothetical protein
MGTLRVSGYVRGGVGLSCDVLVHIPGCGDLLIDRITDENGVVLHMPSDQRPSLQAENEADPFAGGEQTWPTEADVEMAGVSSDEEDDEKANAIHSAVKVRELTTICVFC